MRAQLARLGLPTGTGAPADGRGAEGSAVSDLDFDAPLERAVRSFQQQRGLVADGIVGPETGRALDAARWSLGDRVLRFVPGHLVVGDDVVALQRRLSSLGLFDGLLDGVLGPETERALRELQASCDVAVDGTCGPETLRALARLARTVSGGDAAALRAGESVRRAGASLAGRVIVLDPGYGPHRHTAHDAPRHGLREADVTLDLAERLEGRLEASGVTAVLTRGAGQEPSLRERVQLAQEVRADLFVSLCCDTSPAPEASGVACAYWGHDDVRSPVGSRLAELVQRELVTRTGLADLRSHARAWDVLRLTRMPAVQVDLGYLTSPGDAAKLADAAFRDACAEALLAAVQRLYLPEDDDPPTGTLLLADILARSGR